ncbi:MAG: hypothetical protein WKF84_12135 [Pyrinomonadaceae bacterium]
MTLSSAPRRSPPKALYSSHAPAARARLARADDARRSRQDAAHRVVRMAARAVGVPHRGEHEASLGAVESQGDVVGARRADPVHARRCRRRIAAVHARPGTRGGPTRARRHRARWVSAALGAVCAFAAWREPCPSQVKSLTRQAVLRPPAQGSPAARSPRSSISRFDRFPRRCCRSARSRPARRPRSTRPSLRWLRRVYANQDPVWSVVADEERRLRPLPPLRRGAPAESDASLVLQRKVTSGGYRAPEGPARASRAFLDADTAADASLRRLLWAAVAVLFAVLAL